MASSVARLSHTAARQRTQTSRTDATTGGPSPHRRQTTGWGPSPSLNSAYETSFSGVIPLPNWIKPRARVRLLTPFPPSRHHPPSPGALQQRCQALVDGHLLAVERVLGLEAGL